MRALVGAILAAGLVIGCGGGVAGAYLYQANDRLVFLQMAGEGQSLTGSLTVFSANNFESSGGNAETVDFTGSSSGNSVTFIFPASSSYTGLSATVQGDGLHLSFPGTAGQFEEIVLKRSSQSDYNAAVAAFATAAQQAIASAEAQAAIDKPVVDAAAVLQSALDNLNGVRALDSRGTTSTDSLQKALSDLKTGSGNLTSILGYCHSDPYNGCSESDFDLPIGITYDTYFCQSNWYAPGDLYEQGVKDATSPYFSAASAVIAAADRLDQAVAANPQATKPGISSAQARATATAARSSAASYIVSWNSELKTAEGIRDQATTIYLAAIKTAKKYGLTITPCQPMTWATPLPVPTF